MFREFLKEHEDNIITIVTVLCIIITAIIIIVTWVINIGGSTKEIDLNSFENITYISQMTTEYENVISNLLKTEKVEELYSKMNLKFLEENSLNEENIKSYLLTNELIGNSIGVISSDCIENEGTYIFRYYYKNYNEYKYVNVIEKNPGDYTITFNQEGIDMEEYQNVYNGSLNNVECQISISELGNEFMRLNIKITNNNNLDAEIDMNDINTFSLFGEDINIPVSSLATTSVEKLTKNSSVSKELYFSLSQQDKEKCEGIRVNNIKINDEFFDIEIYF